MPLTESVLQRLTTEALVTFYDQARNFEAVAHSGCAVVLSGEPVTDLNYVCAGAGTSVERFKEAAQSCLDRGLPFLAMLFPAVAETLATPAQELGLVHAVEFPFMVREGVPDAIDPGDVVVTRARGADDARASAMVLSSAFDMPAAAVLRALPAAFLDSPGVDVYLAAVEGRCAGTVTLTYHGDTVGIWAMGVDPELQRRGVGARLLATAMRAATEVGARRYFLGATPAGRPLYERVGFATRVVTQVWASGESGQT